MQRLEHDCSAIIRVPLLDDAGQAVLDGDGAPVRAEVPAPPRLVAMSAPEEAEHRALQASAQAQRATEDAAEQVRADAIRALLAHAQAHPDDPAALLARALGVL